MPFRARSDLCGTGDYAGTIAPDLIAALRVDQAWGLFQASFAAHNNHAAYYGGTELTGHPDDKWGWAGALALSIKNIPTGPGDTINIQGVYTNGATPLQHPELSLAGANTIYGGTNLPGAYQSIGFGVAPDSVFINGGSQQLRYDLRLPWCCTSHNWNPYWNTSDLRCLGRQFSTTSTAKGYICGPAAAVLVVRSALRSPGHAAAVMTSCNPDYSFGQLGTQTTQWTPVKNLTFSADFTYAHLVDQNYAGTIATGQRWASASRPPCRAGRIRTRTGLLSALSVTGNTG